MSADLYIKEFVEKFTRRFAHKSKLVNLLGAWDGVVGKAIAAKSEAYTFKEGTLFVRVSDPLWMNELAGAKVRLLEKLNCLEEVPAVADIKFVFGKVIKSSSLPQAAAQFPGRVDLDSVAIEPEPAEAAADVKNRELAEKLIKLKSVWRKIEKVKKEDPAAYEIRYSFREFKAPMFSKSVYDMVHPYTGVVSDFVKLSDGIQDFL